MPPLSILVPPEHSHPSPASLSLPRVLIPCDCPRPSQASSSLPNVLVPRVLVPPEHPPHASPASSSLPRVLVPSDCPWPPQASSSFLKHPPPLQLSFSPGSSSLLSIPVPPQCPCPSQLSLSPGSSSFPSILVPSQHPWPSQLSLAPGSSSLPEHPPHPSRSILASSKHLCPSSQSILVSPRVSSSPPSRCRPPAAGSVQPYLHGATQKLKSIPSVPPMSPSPCPQPCHRLALCFIVSPATGRKMGDPGGSDGRSLHHGPPASGCVPSRGRGSWWSRGTRRCPSWSSCRTPALGAGRRVCRRGRPHLQGRGQGWGSAVTPPPPQYHGLWLTAAGWAMGDLALGPTRLPLRQGDGGLAWWWQWWRWQVCSREGGEG